MSDIRRYAYLMERGPRLNLGCASNKLEDFVNADIDSRCGPDVLCYPGEGLPFRDGTFQFALVSHVLEHVREPFQLMDELWRVLVPGAAALIVVPHGMSYTQLGTPSHVAAYIPNTFTAFQESRYTEPGNHGYGAFENKQVHPWIVERIDREAKPAVSRLPAWLLLRLEPYLWNIFENLYCVMRKLS